MKIFSYIIVVFLSFLFAVQLMGLVTGGVFGVTLGLLLVAGLVYMDIIDSNTKEIMVLISESTRRMNLLARQVDYVIESNRNVRYRLINLEYGVVEEMDVTVEDVDMSIGPHDRQTVDTKVLLPVR